MVYTLKSHNPKGNWVKVKILVTPSLWSWVKKRAYSYGFSIPQIVYAHYNALISWFLKGNRHKFGNRLFSKYFEKQNEQKKPHVKIFFPSAAVACQSFQRSWWWRHYGQKDILPILFPYKRPTLMSCIFFNFSPFLIVLELNVNRAFHVLV